MCYPWPSSQIGRHKPEELCIKDELTKKRIKVVNALLSAQQKANEILQQFREVQMFMSTPSSLEDLDDHEYFCILSCRALERLNAS